jgi:hypothetical protein
MLFHAGPMGGVASHGPGPIGSGLGGFPRRPLLASSVNRGNAPPIRPKHFLENISALIEIFQYLSIVSIIAM